MPESGVVKWYNDAKGFGFITWDKDDSDVFLHHSKIITPGPLGIHEGRRVTFTVANSPKGPAAENVVADY